VPTGLSSAASGPLTRGPRRNLGNRYPNSVTTTVDLTHGASREGAVTRTAAPHTTGNVADTAVRLPDLLQVASPLPVKRPVLRHTGPTLRRTRRGSAKRPTGDKPARKAARRATAREGTKKEQVLVSTEVHLARPATAVTGSCSRQGTPHPSLFVL
jgi:hypothetical protein